MRKKDKVDNEVDGTKLPQIGNKAEKAGLLNKSDISDMQEERKLRSVTDLSEDTLLHENKSSEKDSKVPFEAK